MSQSSCAPVRAIFKGFVPVILVTAALASPATARPLGDLTPPPNISVVEVEPGDTLEGLLRELGFEGQTLVEIILGFSTELDPDKLQPGQTIEVVWSAREKGRAERLVLTLGDERIELDTTGIFRVATHEPELDWSERAVRVTVEKTLVESIESAGAPSGLGLDLAAALAGIVDFSREVQGGETVDLLFGEGRLPDGEPAGQTRLRYARIEIGGRTLELAREDGEGVPLQVFEDGEPLRQSAAPVSGARISSHFGTRRHPIHGVVRMHTGVDYAARTGTPVYASAPGEVTSVGIAGGYGKMVEIRHDDELTTRYAHLSAFAEGLEVGQSVKAGEQIGDVGATGLATGPHLHYEVRYAGRPVDPLSDEHIAALAGPVKARSPEALLEGMRQAVVAALKASSGA